MINTKRDTRYSLVPQDPREIIACVVVACLSVAAFFALIHLVAFIIKVVS